MPQKKGNGQKRKPLVLFGPKTGVPGNNSDRECCWPYLIGQHPLSPVFGQKRPGAPDYSYFAQLPPVFGQFMFLSSGLLDYSNRSTREQNFAQATWRWTKFSHFSQFWGQPSISLSGGCSEALLDAFGLTITPARTTTRRTYKQMSTERCEDCRQSRQLMAAWTEGITAELCDGY